MPALSVAVPGRAGVVCADCADRHPRGDAIVVADGLGSASLGSLGSYTVAAIVLGALRDDAWAGLPTEALATRLHSLYGEATGGAREVATTCLFAIATRDRLVVGQVGDGLVAVLCTSGALWTMDVEKDFGNETDALPRSVPRCSDLPLDTVDGVFLCSDGVADDLVAGRLPELVHSLLAEARRDPTALETRLHGWLTRWPTPNSHDDRALALLWMPR
ncbi:MAG: protein phosphatase 2C domain-containing protein [Myxococcota bacterium]